MLLVFHDTHEKIETLLNQAAELPEEAQAELLQTLVEMRAQHLGIYPLNEDERIALVLSRQDEQLDRFAADSEVEEVFASYGA